MGSALSLWILGNGERPDDDGNDETMMYDYEDEDYCHSLDLWMFEEAERERAWEYSTAPEEER